MRTERLCLASKLVFIRHQRFNPQFLWSFLPYNNYCDCVSLPMQWHGGGPTKLRPERTLIISGPSNAGFSVNELQSDHKCLVQDKLAGCSHSESVCCEPCSGTSNFHTLYPSCHTRGFPFYPNSELVHLTSFVFLPIQRTECDGLEEPSANFNFKLSLFWVRPL